MSEMEIYRIKKEFQEKVKADIDQNQKEYILREQLKVIRQELGEDSCHVRRGRIPEEAGRC